MENGYYSEGWASVLNMACLIYTFHEIRTSQDSYALFPSKFNKIL